MQRCEYWLAPGDGCAGIETDRRANLSRQRPQTVTHAAASQGQAGRKVQRKEGPGCIQAAQVRSLRSTVTEPQIQGSHCAAIQPCVHLLLACRLAEEDSAFVLAPAAVFEVVKAAAVSGFSVSAARHHRPRSVSPVRRHHSRSRASFSLCRPSPSQARAWRR